MKKALTKINNKELYYYKDGVKVKVDRKDVSTYPIGLSGNVSRLSGNVSRLSGDISRLSGNVSRLSGNVSELSGDISRLRGDCGGLYTEIVLM